MITPISAASGLINQNFVTVSDVIYTTSVIAVLTSHDHVKFCNDIIRSITRSELYKWTLTPATSGLTPSNPIYLLIPHLIPQELSDILTSHLSKSNDIISTFMRT